MIWPPHGGSRNAARRHLALLAILALAECGRFDHLECTVFVLDQACIYAMARDAVARHALPAMGGYRRRVGSETGVPAWAQSSRSELIEE